MSIKFCVDNGIKEPSSIYAGINGSVKEIKSVYVGNSNNEAVKVWEKDHKGFITCCDSYINGIDRYISFNGTTFEKYTMNNKITNWNYLKSKSIFYDEIYDSFILFYNGCFIRSKDLLSIDEICKIPYSLYNTSYYSLYKNYLFFISNSSNQLYMLSANSKESIFDCAPNINNYVNLNAPKQFFNINSNVYGDRQYEGVLIEENTGLLIGFSRYGKPVFCNLDDMIWKESEDERTYQSGMNYANLSIVYFKNLFIIISQNYLLYSKDFVNWLQCDINLGDYKTSTCYFNNCNKRLYLICGSSFSYSDDGIHWSNFMSSLVGNWSAQQIVYFNNKYFAINSNFKGIYGSNDGTKFSQIVDTT